jgi:4-carboxymuconolactone decarboxylase
MLPFSDPTLVLIEASTLAARPELRPELVVLLNDAKTNSRATFAELYEVFLQTYLFAGFPAALEGVRALERAFGLPPERAIEEDPHAIASEYETFFARGEALYQIVYAKNAPRVREEMIRLSPELAAWAMIEGYGKTLSRAGLPTVTRELCIVAQLTQLGWDRQLFSHILGARNTGASPDEIREAARIGARGIAVLFERAEQLLAKLV